MIQEVFLDDIDEVLKLLIQQTYEPDIKRYRSPYVYRGLPDIKFNLKTSLQRNCKHKQNELENCILRNFTKYAEHDEPRINESIWRKLIIGQHHGLPTRLLDWTYSPLVALHFATSGESMDEMAEHDMVIWRIDVNELNSKLPDKYRAILDNEWSYVFTVDMLEKTVDSLSEYDSDMGSSSFVMLEPPSIDQRIVAQYALLSIMPMGMDNIEDYLNNFTDNTVKYTISKDIRWRIRDMLDRINMNERNVYPGLDGLSAWLKRYYFVQ